MFFLRELCSVVFVRRQKDRLAILEADKIVYLLESNEVRTNCKTLNGNVATVTFLSYILLLFISYFVIVTANHVIW